MLTHADRKPQTRWTRIGDPLWREASNSGGLKAIEKRFADLTDGELDAAELVDPDRAEELRLKRETARLAAIAPPAPPPAAAPTAKRSVQERLAPKQVAALDVETKFWRSIADPGFQESFDKALSIWLEAPDRLTSADVSCLRVVNPYAAKEAISARSEPAFEDFDTSDSAERDLSMKQLWNRIRWVDLAIVRLRAMRLEARVKTLEERLTRGADDAVDGPQHSAALELRLRELEARPGLKYHGVHVAGAAYREGDAVTLGGSLWIARSPTRAKPGEANAESRSWVLACKKGSDGKPGINGKDGR